MRMKLYVFCRYFFQFLYQFYKDHVLQHMDSLTIDIYDIIYGHFVKMGTVTFSFVCRVPRFFFLNFKNSSFVKKNLFLHDKITSPQNAYESVCFLQLFYPISISILQKLCATTHGFLNS